MMTQYVLSFRTLSVLETSMAGNSKRCEHFPLLKVSVEGDNVVRSDGGAMCKVHTVSRHRIFGRWPEFMSTCWMAAIVFGICFLTFYVLGVAMSKRQAVVVQYMKQQESRHAESTVRVYYHYVVERGGSVDFLFYSEYLSIMSLLYPNLRINVYFLIHDAYKPSRGHLISNLFDQSPPAPNFYKMDYANTREIVTFQRKHPNVNITVMPLRKYMAMTPLKHKWRNLPMPYISFYARVFAVWQYGGIGIDLSSSNIDHLTHQAPDSRITAILKHLNDGESKYSFKTPNLSRYDYDGVPTILNVMIEMLNKSMEMYINSSLLTPANSTQPLASKHRDKRDIQDTPSYGATNSSVIAFDTEVRTNGTAVNTEKSINTTINDTNRTDLPGWDHGDVSILNEMLQMLNKSIETYSNSSLLTPTNSTEPLASKHKDKRTTPDPLAYNVTTSSVFETEVTTIGTVRNISANPINTTKPVTTIDAVLQNNEYRLPEANADKDCSSTALPNRSEELAQPLIMYGFMEFGDIGPSYKLSEPMIPDFLLPIASIDIQKKDTSKYLLTLDLEGKFVSSFSAYHPLLGHIMLNFQRLAPRVAIQEALMTHCNGLLRNDNFCKNVYIL